MEMCKYEPIYDNSQYICISSILRSVATVVTERRISWLLSHRDHKLTRGSPRAHCKQVMLVTQIDLEQPQARDLSSKFRDVNADARPHLSNGEFQQLVELLAEYEDIFAVNSEACGRANEVYHRIDMGDVRPTRQPLGGFP
jgi:hypothetical protein